jgi:hypothetical protein
VASVELKKRPRWAASFLLLLTGSVLITLFAYSQLIDQVLEFLPPGATAGDKQIVSSQLHHEAFLRMAFLPVRILLGCTSFALFLYYLCRSVSSLVQFRYGQMFAVVVAAELILLAGKGLGTLAALWGLATPDILSALLPSVILSHTTEASTLFTHILSNHLHVFTLWYAVALSCALHVICEFRWIKAGIVAVLAVGAWVALDVAILLIVRDAFQLLP